MISLLSFSRASSPALASKFALALTIPPPRSYLELTQILSSCHDILFSSRDRVPNDSGYSKFLDEFSRSLDGFRRTWEAKRWATFRKFFSPQLPSRAEIIL